MKSSGVQWLGDIPAEWGVIPIKYWFTIGNGSNPTTDEGPIPVYGSGSRSFKTCMESKDGPAVLLGRKGTVNVPQWVEGKYWNVDTAFDVKVKLGGDACLKFLYYCAICFDYDYYTTKTSLPSMTQNTYYNYKIPLINIADQQAIASYLDDRCSKLDEIIAEAEKSIEDYKELKQAVIANAVLRGLKDNVTYKNTGEKWCVTIPYHWRFERGKNLFRETNIRSIDGSEELLTVSQYTGITPRSMKNVTMFEATSLVDYKICAVGDIAANTMWMWAGAVGVSGYYGVISPSYNTYRQIKGDYNSRYLDYLLRAVPLVSEYESLSTGIRASRLRLYPSQFLSIRYPVPPMTEQKDIVEFLDRKDGDMDALISEKQSLIEDLKAYKKSLIYEVVTGKRRIS